MFLAVLASALCCGAIAAASASALEERQATGPAFGSFSRATGIAVDQSDGDVYVADGGEDEQLQVFGSEGGAPVGGGPASFDGSNTPSEAFGFRGEPVGPAVANGKVYVPNVGKNLVDEFALNGMKEYEFTCEITGVDANGPSCLGQADTGSEFREPLGAALDSAGDLYIADYGSATVYEFDPAGEEVQSFASPLLGSPQFVAVDATGDVYVQSYDKNLVEFKRSSLTGEAQEAVQIAEGVTGVAVDRATGSVFVDLGYMIEELDASHKVVETFGLGSVNGGLGIAVNEATNVVYMVNESGISRFGQPVLVPGVDTGSASEVDRTSATLEGVVDPDGLATTYHFEYGTTAQYGSSTSASSAGAGTEGVSVDAVLTGLKTETVYHFRVVAENENGMKFGADETFETGGAVEGILTGQADDVLATGATLNGSLEPNGFDTHWFFEYGLSEAYGSNTPSQDAGEASETVNLQATVTGLEANTTYHDRIVASNESGVSYGLDETFTTLPVPPVIEGVPGVSEVTRSSATVRATVDPKHSITSYHFVYVEDSQYEPAADDPYAAGGAGMPVSAGAGASAETVEQLLSGLKPGTTYHYTVVAINQSGRASGADETFTTAAGTPPTAVTGSSNEVAQNGATIDGVLDTNGLPTSYGFEIGTSTDYGPPTGLGSVGAGLNEAQVSLALSGLQPGTTYHYRLTATNVDGTSYGADETFTTSVFASTFATPPAPLPFVAVPSIAFPTQPKAVVKKSATKKKPRRKSEAKKSKGRKQARRKKRK
jgi:hypothetical protein